MTQAPVDTHLSVTIESEDISFDAFRRVITYVYREDESGITAKREIVVGRHAVAGVVYDPKAQKLIMIRQFRLGAQLGTGRGFTAEIVAGLIDEGDDAETTIRRELTEETGLTASRVEPLCAFLTTPGMTDEVLHLFYVEADASAMGSQAGAAYESERTFPFMLSREEALEAVDNNLITNGIAMLGILWFDRHFEKLTGTHDVQS